jgi:nicotinamidase-related amidase
MTDNSLRHIHFENSAPRKRPSMAVTRLDTQTALIIVDLQKGIVSMPCAHPVSDVVEKSAALARRFRELKLPVVLVNVAGRAPGRTERSFSSAPPKPDWADIVDELGQTPDDLVVTKHSWGAFNRTELEAMLRKLGVTQVVITGVATSAGVESTARQAFELGFNVTLAVDAMTDMSAAAHDNSIGIIFPKLGETGTTADILNLLENREA